nr:replication initiator [Mycobacterium persicum]
MCPSCSDLYARDTWQLVHAGAAGGHHNVHAEVASRCSLRG